MSILRAISPRTIDPKEGGREDARFSRGRREPLPPSAMLSGMAPVSAEGAVRAGR